MTHNTFISYLPSHGLCKVLDRNENPSTENDEKLRNYGAGKIFGGIFNSDVIYISILSSGPVIDRS